MQVHVVPVKLVYPLSLDEVGFMVVEFKTIGEKVGPWQTFRAKGIILPTGQGEYILEGTYSEHQKEFLAQDYTLISCNPTQYLKSFSGMFKQELLDDIFAKIGSGMDGLEKLSADPSCVADCFSSPLAAKAFIQDFVLRHARKDLFLYLLQDAKLTCENSIEITLQAKSVQDFEQNIFDYSVQGLLTYKAAKEIAKRKNPDILNTSVNAKAAVIDILRQAEGTSRGDTPIETTGNTFCPKEFLVKEVSKSLHVKPTDSVVGDAIASLQKEGKIKIVQFNTQKPMVYRTETFLGEYGIAKELTRLNSASRQAVDYTNTIYSIENKKRMRLAPEQRFAVKTALNNPVALIVGGPGTGKTTIELTILETFRLHNPGCKAVLIAPTGRASRRMSESTGEPAMTIHKMLGVKESQEVIQSDVTVDADIILVDEASMIDTQVGAALFKAIKTGTKVILVGDTNQLPSVGCGNVLFELIASKVFATAWLETVYRQKAGGTIATNCARIKAGNGKLIEGEGYEMHAVNSSDEAVAKVLEVYKREMDKGISFHDICILSPYRRTTSTGVNALNPLLKQCSIQETEVIETAKKRFALGEKIISMANKGDVSNGDVGYIVEIDAKKKYFVVDFQDGRILTFKKSDMKDFDLAYAMTIHKSQGSEYHTCIIVMMEEHQAMLKRNLLYTAVSRAKQNAIIIGQESAIQTAIQTEDVTKRQSNLGRILETLASLEINP